MEDFVTRCNKRFGKHSKCGQIATLRIVQASDTQCRCDKHSQGFPKEAKHIPIIHDWEKINTTLASLVGKVIYSTWHRRELKVQYVKRSSMLLMCQDARYDGASKNKNHARWFAVYAKEITNIID